MTRALWEPQTSQNERKEALRVHQDSDSRQRQYTDSVRVTPPRALRRSRRRTTLVCQLPKQHVAGGPFGAGGLDAGVPVLRQHRHGERLCGSTGHADGSLKKTRDMSRSARDLGHGGSSLGGTYAWMPKAEQSCKGSDQFGGAAAWPAQTSGRQLQRGREVVESLRRVCQERRAESAPGAARDEGCHNAVSQRDETDATNDAVSRRDETDEYPWCGPNAQEKGGVKLNEQAMECHGGAHERTPQRSKKSGPTASKEDRTHSE